MSSWAKDHIARLHAGETVQFRPRGHSMRPCVNDGDLVTIEPVSEGVRVAVDDIVLCTVRGRDYLHLVKAVGGRGFFLIGNNRGGINGWTHKIHGRVIRVEP